MKKYLLALSSAVLLTACGESAQPASTLVYINSGALQCESTGKTVAETAQLLTEQNITVSESQCGHLTNMMVATVCGGATTDINLHRIALSDLEKAQAVGFADVQTLKDADNLGYDISECK